MFSIVRSDVSHTKHLSNNFPTGCLCFVYYMLPERLTLFVEWLSYVNGSTIGVFITCFRINCCSRRARVFESMNGALKPDSCVHVFGLTHLKSDPSK